MPIYAYKCPKCGMAWEDIVNTPPKTAKCECGGLAARDMASEWGPTSREHAADPWANGHMSNALGVLPKRIPEKLAKLRKLPNCSTVDFLPDGRCVTHSKKQREAVMASMRLPDGSRMVDKESYY